MKKLVLIITFLLVVSVNKVKAEDYKSCEIKFNQIKAGVVQANMGNGNIENNNLWMGILSSKVSSEKSIGFCLDRGKNSRGGATYIQLSNVRISEVMKKAYNFTKNIDSSSLSSRQDEQVRYLVAQLAVWSDQTAGAFKYNSSQFKVETSKTIVKYICDPIEDFYAKSACQRSVESSSKMLIDKFVNTSPTTEQLCVYGNPNDADKTNYNSWWQRFVGKCITPVCPPNYEPSTPGPDTPANCGPTLQQVGSPAVCSLNNQNNTGYLSEELVYDPNNCGDAMEDAGEPTRQIGDYCYLYCKEEVIQSYPGGISNPISLGVNIVWPTSAATEKTIWGNLYSLSYKGTKTCKIKVAPNTKQTKNVEDTFANAATIISNYRKNYGTNSYYSAPNCQANLTNKVNERESDVNSKKQDFNAKNASLKEAQANYENCERNRQNCEATKSRCEREYNEKVTACKNNCYRSDKQATDTCIQLACGPDAIPYTCTSCGSCNAESNQATQADQASERAYTALQNAEASLAQAKKELGDCKKYVDASNVARTIMNELNTCYNASFAPEDLYKFESSTSITYDDPEFGATYPLTGNTTYGCTNCEKPANSVQYDESKVRELYQQLMQNINDREIVITANATYTLPNDDSIYKYVDKTTNQPLKNPTENTINIGYGFLPTSYTKAKTGKKYNLKINVDCLGENCKFTEIANNNYTCNYSHIDGPPSECVCPDGTDNAGQDLFPLIYNSNTVSKPMTCAEAQYKYCGKPEEEEQYFCPSDETINITTCINGGNGYKQCVDQLCPGGSGDKFCPNDRNMNISACINSGNNYQYCVDTLCNVNDDFHCPKGTFNDGMDIKPCVFANIHLGIEAARQFCQDTVCPGGNRIIYRVIDNYTPFPGKTAGVGKYQTTLSFNLTNTRGRTPGYNWNSVNLVHDQILYNRGVTGNKVYEKEPLYTFILDKNTVTEIRHYNDQQEKKGGYADYTLDCNANGVACISPFVRDAKYGLTGGVCSDASKGEFYQCSES